jgi:hypothetical protein
MQFVHSHAMPSYEQYAPSTAHVCPSAADRKAGHAAGGSGSHVPAAVDQRAAPQLAKVRHCTRGSSPYSHTTPLRLQAAPSVGATAGHTSTTPASVVVSGVAPPQPAARTATANNSPKRRGAAVFM